MPQSTDIKTYLTLVYPYAGTGPIAVCIDEV